MKAALGADFGSFRKLFSVNYLTAARAFGPETVRDNSALFAQAGKIVYQLLPREESAEGRTRTGTCKSTRDFKSLASTNSATSAFKDEIGGGDRNRTDE